LLQHWKKLLKQKLSLLSSCDEEMKAIT